MTANGTVHEAGSPQNQSPGSQAPWQPLHCETKSQVGTYCSPLRIRFLSLLLFWRSHRNTSPNKRLTVTQVTGKIEDGWTGVEKSVCSLLLSQKQSWDLWFAWVWCSAHSTFQFYTPNETQQRGKSSGQNRTILSGGPHSLGKVIWPIRCGIVNDNLIELAHR